MVTLCMRTFSNRSHVRAKQNALRNSTYLRRCCEVDFLHEFLFCFKIHREVLTEEVLQPYIDGLEIRTDDQRLADVSGDFTWK